MRVRGLAEVALFTARFSEVVRFYEVLSDSRPAERSDGHVVFRFGAVTMLIHVSEGAVGEASPAPVGAWPPDEDHFAFAVADLDDVVVQLRQEGLEISGPHDYPWGRSAYTRDPDGRLVELEDL